MRNIISITENNQQSLIPKNVSAMTINVKVFQIIAPPKLDSYTIARKFHDCCTKIHNWYLIKILNNDVIAHDGNHMGT